MIKALIIDDENRARAVLKQMLSSHCPQVKVMGEATGVNEGLTAIATLQPQLVFLDIQMTDGTGFELLQQLPRIDFHLVFITAYEKYAVEAFKYSALDYVLKPISPSDLVRAVEKTHEALVKENLQLQIQALMSNIQRDQRPEKLILKTQESIFAVGVEEIMRLEADGSYTAFFLNDGRKLLVSQRMKTYEELLPRKQFYRTHNSHVINLSRFREFNRKEDLAILSDGSSVPVSTRRRQGLFDRLG